MTKKEAETIRENIRAIHPDYEEGFLQAVCDGLQSGLFIAERIESGDYVLTLTDKGKGRATV